MGKDLRIFTTPFKDELISSFLQRNSELRGGDKFDRYKITAVGVYRGSRKVDDFFERYPFDNLMENHTLLPLSRRFQFLQDIRSFPGPVAPAIHLKVCLAVLFGVIFYFKTLTNFFQQLTVWFLLVAQLFLWITILLKEVIIQLQKRTKMATVFRQGNLQITQHI